MTGCPALVFALILAVPALANAAGACPEDQTRASGQPERTIFSREASRGIRAAWCEAYDAAGRSTRVGAYRERYPTGLLRLEANYERGRLNGPVGLRSETFVEADEVEPIRNEVSKPE